MCSNCEQHILSGPNATLRLVRLTVNSDFDLRGNWMYLCYLTIGDLNINVDRNTSTYGNYLYISEQDQYRTQLSQQTVRLL